jgi:HSP20 family protein
MDNKLTDPGDQQSGRSISDEVGMFSARLWHPVTNLREAVDRIVEDLASMRHSLGWRSSDRGSPPSAFAGFGSGAMWPPCEIDEEDGEYRLSMELPGFAENEIAVEIVGDVLTIGAEHQERTEERAGGRRYTERRQGRAVRAFQLPTDVDRDAITARSRSGIVTITLPKSEVGKAERRRIEIAKA